MQYRPFELKDLEVYRSLRARALDDFPTAFGACNEEEGPIRDDRFRIMTSHEFNFAIGAFEGESCVGMVGFLRKNWIKVQHKGLIWGMFVVGERQGQGIGKKLLEVALNKAFEQEGLLTVDLEVIAHNKSAIGMYERMGFTRFGLEPNAMFVEGKMYDSVMMYIHRENWKSHFSKQ